MAEHSLHAHRWPHGTVICVFGLAKQTIMHARRGRLAANRGLGHTSSFLRPWHCGTHAVATLGGCNFDAAEARALPLTRAALGRCAAQWCALLASGACCAPGPWCASKGGRLCRDASGGGTLDAEAVRAAGGVPPGRHYPNPDGTNRVAACKPTRSQMEAVTVRASGWRIRSRTRHKGGHLSQQSHNATRATRAAYIHGHTVKVNNETDPLQLN